MENIIDNGLAVGDIKYFENYSDVEIIDFTRTGNVKIRFDVNQNIAGYGPRMVVQIVKPSKLSDVSYGLHIAERFRQRNIQIGEKRYVRTPYMDGPATIRGLSEWGFIAVDFDHGPKTEVYLSHIKGRVPA